MNTAYNVEDKSVGADWLKRTPHVVIFGLAIALVSANRKAMNNKNTRNYLNRATQANSKLHNLTKGYWQQ